MKKYLLLSLAILLFSTSLFAQKTDSSYTPQWHRAYRFELNDLPKSAAAVVDSIYVQAKKDGNGPQLVKTLLYQSKFMITLEEEAQLKVVGKLKEEIATNPFPVKNILESILANIYWQYYSQNRYQIYKRTRTKEKSDSVDFRTWDLATLFAEIHHHYQKSLEQEALLQETDLQQFNAILLTSEGSKIFRPALFDFLAHNALPFYQSAENSLTRPAYKFEIDDPQYFTSFLDLDLKTKDSLSLPFHALKIYQKLLWFHAPDQDPSALVTADLERLEFVRKNAVLAGKEELYLNQLLNLKEKHQQHSVSASINYLIASFYHQQANYYRKGVREENRFKKREALQSCEEAISHFPESRGAENCEALKKEILQENLEITSEKFIPVGLPSRLLIDYKNLDSLQFSVHRITLKEEKAFHELSSDSARQAFIATLPMELEWQSALRNEKDFQQHKTEILVPPLPQGNFMMLSLPKAGKLKESGVYGYTSFQVTDLALIENNHRGIPSFQLIDRNTGRPVKGANVRLENREGHHYSNFFDRSFVTDANGLFSVNTREDLRSLKATASFKKDTAVFGDYYLNKSLQGESNKKEKVTVTPFLFTDRSIYRPGQKVFFKGILIKKQGQESEIIAGEYVEVKLENVNRQATETLELKTNEYGSFSGEFTLPANGLSGKFTITVKESLKESSKLFVEIMDYFDFTRHTILVGEYKRPKFEASFKPVTETYRLNDTIAISGTAISFAESNITAAKVVYRVKRTVHYPRWFSGYFSYPYQFSHPMEITHGETTTNSEGTFKINFKAIPDPAVYQESQPVFHYEITADVTDLNGETRTASSVVRVGYHSLKATIQTPEKIDLSTKDQKISIRTENLNGKFAPANGTLRMYKLQAPENVLRKRPWSAPDYQEFSKAEFRALFPHDPYENEDNPENRKKGNLVWESSFDTGKQKEVVPEWRENLEQGKYVIELETMDAFGQKVMDIHHFTLFSSKNNKPADNTLFTIQTDKAVYAPGEKVLIQLSSAAKDVTVTLFIENNNHQISKTLIIPLSNEIKKLKIPVRQGDTGGFALHYLFAAYNSFESGQVMIAVPYPKENISIETLSFRDKLQPGENQTWSFKLSGANKNKLNAEFLAGMYDASLDQFQDHSWNFNPINSRLFYTYSLSNGKNSFGNAGFSIQNQRYYKSKFSPLQFDRLDWFGFSFTENRYANFQYLNRISFLSSPTPATPSTLKSKRDNNLPSGLIIGKVTVLGRGKLTGVSVFTKGTRKGTVTDRNGNFSIKAFSGDTIIFSFVGFNPLQVRVGKQNVLEVSMAPEVQELEEVVVVGYSSESMSHVKNAFSVMEVADEEKAERMYEMVVSEKGIGVEINNQPGNAEKMRARGASFLQDNPKALFVVDGVVRDEFDLAREEMLTMEILKGAAAIGLYGAAAANGAVIITTKEGQEKLDAAMAQLKVRTNLQETAFFYPHLSTDKNGEVSFTFTAPEALTRWKLQLLAHTKSLSTAAKTLQTVTQQELMVMPNPPRFLREGDEIIFSAKISSLNSLRQSGFAALQLSDALSGNPVDEAFGNMIKNQPFEVAAGGNTEVSWKLKIPSGIQALEYKVVAKAGDFSDGEQSILPILPNRMLVSETLPLWARSGQSKTFRLDKLISQQSTSLQHQGLTLEITSNPAWYALQALPYLMEYPFECAEQTFARYYANAIAGQLMNSEPKLKEVFDSWSSANTLESNLEKNEELKSILIQETPWLREAQSETEQKKRLGLLFDLKKLEAEQSATFLKLKEMQMANGGFPWFKGSDYPNRNISLHIAAGLGKLQKMVPEADQKIHLVLRLLFQYLDEEMVKDYQRLLKNDSSEKEKKKNDSHGKEKDYMVQNHLGPLQLQYLYMSSFYPQREISPEVRKAIDYYLGQSVRYWKEQPLYFRGMIALIQHRQGHTTIPQAILKSLKENSITSEEMGMYWKENKASWFWYQSPVETQALLIEAFSEIGNPSLSDEDNRKVTDEMKIWLLKHKQTKQWPTTKATTEAVYAILQQGSDWLSVTDAAEVSVGNVAVDPSTMENVSPEAGTGYFKTAWKGPDIKPEMGEVKITTKANEMVWGGLYWQYFEDLDKITSAETPLQLSKKLFLKKNTHTGEEISEIKEGTALSLGDLIRVRIEVKVDREMDFVHMKDMRASGLEPVNVLSQYKWQDGLGYYESTKDASTNFFFDVLPKGVYVFEYDLRVNNKGNFSNGITTIQSMYAPEFSSHSKGVRVNIAE